MIEKRKNARRRVIYHGVIAINQRSATIECVVRNFSDDGIKIELEDPAQLPDEIDLFIAKKNRAFSAKIAWIGDRQLGLAFLPRSQKPPIPMDWTRRMNLSESERREIQNMNRLLAGH